MVVVDFYAPWCHWCQILEPTWKQVARDAPEKPFGKDTRVTKVNCEINRELCMQHNIRAYPTINLYVGGSTIAEESYYGDRTTQAIFGWMEHEHKVLDVTIEQQKEDAAVAEQMEAVKEAAAKVSQGLGKMMPGHARLRLKGDQGKLLGVEGCAVKGCEPSTETERSRSSGAMPAVPDIAIREIIHAHAREFLAPAPAQGGVGSPVDLLF